MDFHVSVALASYNGAAFLREQLDSLAAQTLAPAEVVVSDDASADDTCAIVEAFAAAAPFPVRLHRNSQNLGHHRNFLKAAGLCSGAWVAFSDQDDVWLPEKLETVARRAGRGDVSAVVHAARIVGPTLAPTGGLWPRIPAARRDDFTTAHATAHIENSGHALTFRRDLLNRIDAAELGIDVSHDAWAGLLAYALDRLARIPDVLVLHRRHDAAKTFVAAGADRLRPVRVARGVGGEVYRGNSDLLRAFAALLRRTDPEKAGAPRGRLDTAADRYDRFAAAFDGRAAMHEKAFAPAALLGNLARGAYSRPPAGCGLGRRALIKDAAAAFGLLS